MKLTHRDERGIWKWEWLESRKSGNETGEEGFRASQPIRPTETVASGYRVGTAVRSSRSGKRGVFLHALAAFAILLSSVDRSCRYHPSHPLRRKALCHSETAAHPLRLNSSSSSALKAPEEHAFLPQPAPFWPFFSSFAFSTLGPPWVISSHLRWWW